MQERSTIFGYQSIRFKLRRELSFAGELSGDARWYIKLY